MNAVPQVMVRRDRVTKFPETWDAYYDGRKSLKAKGHPLGQLSAIRSGDPPTFAIRCCGRTAARRWKPTEDGGDQQQEHDRLRQVHDGLLQGYLRRGRLGVDDQHNARSCRQTISSTLNGASIYIEALRQSGQVHHREG